MELILCFELVTVKPCKAGHMPALLGLTLTSSKLVYKLNSTELAVFMESSSSGVLNVTLKENSVVSAVVHLW